MPKYNIYDYKYQNKTFMIIKGLGLYAWCDAHDYMTKMVHQTPCHYIIAHVAMMWWHYKWILFILFIFN
jgi:hypothetical protein